VDSVLQHPKKPNPSSPPNHNYSGSGSGYFATDGQTASLSWCRAPIWGPCPDLYYCRIFAVFMLSRPLWREGDSAIDSCNLLSSPKSRRTDDHILLSHTRLPQPEGPGPCIYIPQEQIGSVIPPGTGCHDSFPMASAIWHQHGPHRKHRFQYFLYFCMRIHCRNWKLQTQLLVREGVPHQQTRNCLRLFKERRGRIGRGSQMGTWHQDRLADWPSVVI
jgi:hypothetical protein